MLHFLWCSPPSEVDFHPLKVTSVSPPTFHLPLTPWLIGFYQQKLPGLAYHRAGRSPLGLSPAAADCRVCVKILPPSACSHPFGHFCLVSSVDFPETIPDASSLTLLVASLLSCVVSLVSGDCSDGSPMQVLNPALFASCSQVSPLRCVVDTMG